MKQNKPVFPFGRVKRVLAPFFPARQRTARTPDNRDRSRLGLAQTAVKQRGKLAGAGENQKGGGKAGGQGKRPHADHDAAVDFFAVGGYFTGTISFLSL